MRLAATLRALSEVLPRLLLTTPRSLLHQLPTVTIPKVSSKTIITGMTISRNVSFDLSSSRPFTESAKSSCIPGIRSNSTSEGDCNGNDDKGNNGTCGGDDRCRGAGKGVEGRPSMGLSDAVEYIRARIIDRTEGGERYDDDDDEGENRDHPDVVQPVLDLNDYVHMSADFKAQKAVLEEFRLSSDEYLDLVRLHESRRTAEVLWKEDPERVKKAIERWKQERPPQLYERFLL